MRGDGGVDDARAGGQLGPDSGKQRDSDAPEQSNRSEGVDERKIQSLRVRRQVIHGGQLVGRRPDHEQEDATMRLDWPVSHRDEGSTPQHSVHESEVENASHDQGYHQHAGPKSLAVVLHLLFLRCLRRRLAGKLQHAVAEQVGDAIATGSQ